MKRPCDVADCPDPVRARGWCRRPYRQCDRQPEKPFCDACPDHEACASGIPQRHYRPDTESELTPIERACLLPETLPNGGEPVVPCRRCGSVSPGLQDCYCAASFGESFGYRLCACGRYTQQSGGLCPCGRSL